MGDLKFKYFPVGKMLIYHFTKPLQGAAFWKFRDDIKRILEDTPNTDFGWERPNDTFIPIPQECVERSNGKTDIGNN